MNLASIQLRVAGQSQCSYSVEIFLYLAHVIGPSPERARANFVKKGTQFCSIKSCLTNKDKWFNKQCYVKQ